MKKILIHIRTWVKLISVVVLASCLIVGIIAYIYKPTYSVSINGEVIGYTKDKSKLQERINEIENGDGQNIAFVEVENLPEYKLCLLKRDVEPNDDEIFDIVKQSGKTYYKYYAILQAGEEKLYVASFGEAEQAINELKKKNSKNRNELTIKEKFVSEAKDVVTKEEVISKLYEKEEVVRKLTNSSGNVKYASSANTSNKKVALAINLIRPVSGTVTSRFGSRWGSTHKGIDIGAPKGTAIKAAASGTVISSSMGYNGGYGNCVVISHGNGIETAYGHCSALYVKVGQKVSQGDVIAAVGNTGRSFGNHLHLEIRINGVAQNPQNYLY
ncbi:MAG: M23 family metallopeptidase [Clostridia bacterium]|nr:M23 family metallopeptidase [Clostridia bacterium]